MTEMKDSGVAWINTIPKKWKLKKIKYALKNRNENNNPIRSKNILSLTAKQGVIPLEEKEGGGNKPKEDYSAYKLAYPNDIVMNSMNVLSGSVGLSKYFGCVSPVYYMLRPIDEKDDVRYYNYIFQTTVFQRSLLGLGNGILMKESDNGKLNTIRMRIPLDKLGNLLIPVPDSSIQRKIADYLDSIIPNIDMLLADIEKQIETLEEYKKSIITEAVTKGLDPDVEMKDSGISYIGNIPKHWKVTNLKYLGKCQNGISKGGEYFGNGFPFVSYGDVYKNYSIPQNVDGLIMSTKTEQNIYSVKYGDVFFTRTSETIEEIGFASTCLKSIDNSVFAGFLIRFRPTSSDLIPEFSKFYFRSNIHRKFFVKEMNLVTRASLSQNLLGRLPVLLPPLCEQQIIAKNLEKKCAEIDGAIEEKKEQLETLEQYKKSLIYEYVTGKKEVK
ncbi:restriction endonuclease subunit S [Roseburia intestinalis]|uniref:restriction endonuclease subunit S n=1 Tax=Roseburia intestinalis TaxID=166486 RepID=UPI00201B97A9|nr:restriction endonuclease subunit S [Roseburia intestinalis]UQT31057.1 restriction endonuclease subunit S [Roseburia intestinalis]